jgi:macrolide transport system ATP-binding/permease protein
MRAKSILTQLGLGDRHHHRPGQLSGGQQQRVSIGRALMNDAEVILADEPTGALDSQSGGDVLDILQHLHRQGRTIIIVTHDRAVAQRAGRIIELRDGVIISDETNERAPESGPPQQESHPLPAARVLPGIFERFCAAFLMAVYSMNAHRMRTLLTMTGIIVGTASIICVMAIGQGMQQKILRNISRLGTNTIYITPGEDAGDLNAATITTLTLDDARALAKLPYVVAASPNATEQATARYEGKELNVTYHGVGRAYFRIRGKRFAEGRSFTAREYDEPAGVAVIDTRAKKALFPGHKGSVTERVIRLRNVPLRIIGVVEATDDGPGASQQAQIYIPYSSLQIRFTGSQMLEMLIIRVADSLDGETAGKLISALLRQRHGKTDFSTFSTDTFQKTVRSTTASLTLLVSGIAAISLFVGGVGVMNIMLVSVSERISEIGVRMAIGARRSDILQQFLIEAVIVCLTGGVFGVGFAFLLGPAINAFHSGFALSYSLTPVVIALVSSSLIGIGFGFAPARRASKLDPVTAISGQ